MSSSTPLLPKPDRKKNEHSMFLRVCHSPHSFISQKTLRFLRGVIALYMIGAFGTRIYYDFSIPEILLHGWRSPFQPSNISWLFLTIYEIRGFIWTHMHLKYPRLQSEPDSFGKSIKTLFSPARKPGFFSRLLFNFSYNGSTILNFVVTFMHWAVIIQHKKLPLPGVPKPPLFFGLPDAPDTPDVPDVPDVPDIPKLPLGPSQYEIWVMVNFYIVNSLISLIELFFFSSIRCDQPISVHTAWGFITGMLLVGWLYLGHYLTGEYIYFFLDLGAYPPNKVAAMVGAFITLVETVYLFNHFVIVFRQSVTAKQNNRRRPRLPR